MAAAAQLSALLPAVTLLEGRPPNGSHALEAHIEAAQLDAALSGQQLDYLRTFAVLLAATFAAQPEGSPHFNTNSKYPMSSPTQLWCIILQAQ